MNRPGKVATFFNTAVNANTDILTTNYTPKATSAMRLTVALADTDSIVNLNIKSGSTTVKHDLNNGTALTVGRLYTFSFGVDSAYSYNLQVETGTTVSYLLLEEILDGVL
jgi:predicted alpha-1,6-mannanase (GH76 family)